MLSGWQEEEEGVDKCMQPRGRRQRSGELVVCGQELGPWPTGPLPHLASTGQGGQVSGLGPPLHIILADHCSHPSPLAPCQLMVMPPDTPGTTGLL